MRRHAVLLLVLVAFVPLAAAEHPQTVLGGNVAFDHKGGNEWWVQVKVLTAGATLAKVEAQDTGGSWKALTLRSWGDWAGSFHVEPGHEVRFRATFTNGDVEESCWFSHPGGVEDCGTAPPPPPPPGDFDATFSGAKGNEWWIEVKVAANQPLAGVDARVDGGTWIPLEKKSWGAWAKSIRAPEGSIVHFRARSTGGAEDVAPTCYRWTSATSVECGSGTGGGTEPSGFDATFSSVKGNEWWVEVKVGANEPLAGVDVRTDGSYDWKPLSKKSWGAWAASFHIENRTHLQFRARAADGDFERSECWMWYPPQKSTCGYLWPTPGDFVKTRLVTTSRWEGHDETMWANVTYEAQESAGGYKMVYTCSWNRKVVEDGETTWSTGVIKDDGGMVTNRNSVSIGETIGFQAPVGCGARSWSDAAVVDRMMDVPTWIYGRATTVDGWDARDAPGGPVTVNDLQWERTHGLTLRWDVAFTDNGVDVTSKGEVVDASGPYQ